MKKSLLIYHYRLQLVLMFLLCNCTTFNTLRIPSGTNTHPITKISAKYDHFPKALEGPALIVVHASTKFDDSLQAKNEIDKKINEFKAKQLPVIYLMSDLTPQGQALWYTNDRNPDYVVYSTGGEHNIPLTGSDLTVVGGFWGNSDMRSGCHSSALRNVVLSYFHWEQQRSPLSIHLPIGAIYFFNDFLSMREELIGNMGHLNTVQVDDLARSVLTDRHSKNDELELGEAFLSIRETEIGPNPFVEQNPSKSSFHGKKLITMSASDGTISSIILKTPDERYLRTFDNRYIEGPSVGVLSYTFNFINAETLIKSFGKGPRQVNFIIEP